MQNNPSHILRHFLTLATALLALLPLAPAWAVATRRAILQAMAESKSLVAGMHLPFPGMGHVRLDSEGSYSWVPSEFGQAGPYNQQRSVVSAK